MLAVGLLKAIQDACIAESGLEFVESKGKPFARFGTKSGGSNFERKLAVSTDSKIMRGDLVKVLYDADVRQRAEIDATNKNAGVTQGVGSLQYEFGQMVTGLTQRDDGSDGGVEVTFADGRQAHYDLVVAADGGSCLGPRPAMRHRGASARTHAAYYSIPRAGRGPRATTTSRAYIAHGSRGVLKRIGDRDVISNLISMKDIRQET
jgi:hypothetical protein